MGIEGGNGVVWRRRERGKPLLRGGPSAGVPRNGQLWGSLERESAPDSMLTV